MLEQTKMQNTQRQDEPGKTSKPSRPIALEFLRWGEAPPHPETHNAYSQWLSGCVRMILPQVHLRKPCYDFSFL